MIYAKDLRKVGGDDTTLVYWGDFEVDSAADFADFATTFPDAVFIMSSKAHSISDNKKYMLDSSGNWVEQEESPFSDVYTKTEVDNLLDPINSNLITLNIQTQKTENLLNDSFNGYTKNLLNVFAAASGQTATINGIDWAVQADGTVTANGTASANSFFYIIPANTYKVFGVPTIMNGCPPGGSSTTYGMQTAVGSEVQNDYGDGDGVSMGESTPYRYVTLVVRQGYVASNLTFKPMIVDEEKFGRNSGFVAWSPSLQQLYQMIRQYHP